MPFGDVVHMGILVESYVHNGYFRSKGMFANRNVTTVTLTGFKLFEDTPYAF